MLSNDDQSHLRAKKSPQSPMAFRLLDKGSFTLKNAQCLFQTSDLSSASTRALCVRLGLSNALRLHPSQILKNSIQLGLHCGTVSGVIGRILVQFLRLLHLVGG